MLKKIISWKTLKLSGRFILIYSPTRFSFRNQTSFWQKRGPDSSMLWIWALLGTDLLLMLLFLLYILFIINNSLAGYEMCFVCIWLTVKAFVFIQFKNHREIQPEIVFTRRKDSNCPSAWKKCNVHLIYFCSFWTQKSWSCLSALSCYLLLLGCY